MAEIPKASSNRSIILVGLMGEGKSSIGKYLAKSLVLPFYDSDDQIVSAANCSIHEFFKLYGEAEFRKLEERVIQRLLSGPKHVLATGGGAFMSKKTRTVILNNGISVWLRASLEVLLERTSRREGRPLLSKGNPREILKSLMDQRYPTYTQADIIIDTHNQPHQNTVDQIINSYKKILG